MPRRPPEMIYRHSPVDPGSGAIILAAGAASAGTYTSGSWTLTAPSTDTYSAAVQQPVNADGSSVFNHKSSTIPVQFKVTDTSKFAFESIESDGLGGSGVAPAADNAYSALAYTPPAGTTVSSLTSLVANYGWVYGTDHGGSPQSIDRDPGRERLRLLRR